MDEPRTDGCLVSDLRATPSGPSPVTLAPVEVEAVVTRVAEGVATEGPLFSRSGSRFLDVVTDVTVVVELAVRVEEGADEVADLEWERLVLEDLSDTFADVPFFSTRC